MVLSGILVCRIAIMECFIRKKVKSGTIFDNFLITDDEDYAKEFGDETWGETKGPEKKMKEKVRGMLGAQCEM